LLAGKAGPCGPGEYGEFAPCSERFTERVMKTIALIGIILIVLGVVSFAYQGISYTTHKKVIDVGPLQASTEQHKTIPLPPVFGGFALVGCVILLIVSGKQA
jgi:hypothetical protein